MRNRLPARVPLAIVMFAAVVAAALRAAARRPGPREVPGTEPWPVTVTAEDSLPQPAAVHHTARPEVAKPPGTLRRPDSSVGRTQYVFHELHAEGRHALCEVCADQ